MGNSSERDYLRAVVGRGLDALATGLRPFVEQTLLQRLGSDWAAQVKGSLQDPQTLLGLMSRHWDAAFRAEFQASGSRTIRAHVNELLDARNRWAHNESFDQQQSVRTLDTARLLLRALNAEPQAEQLEELLTEVRTSPSEGPPAAGKRLVVIPCSKKKTDVSERVNDRAPTALSALPHDLRERLERTRKAQEERSHLDRSVLAPAWKRYAGHLYGPAALGDALGRAVSRGEHVLIIGGAYGVVRADEPIGRYEAELQLEVWGDLIGQCLTAYASHHGIRQVRAFVREGAYAEAVRRGPWAAAGIEDARIVLPEGQAHASTENLALGQAVSTFLESGTLPANWASKQGVCLRSEPLT